MLVVSSPSTWAETSAGAKNRLAVVAKALRNPMRSGVLSTLVGPRKSLSPLAAGFVVKWRTSKVRYMCLSLIWFAD